MSSDPKSTASSNKTLIPILLVIGVLLCGCVAVPAVGGIAMFAFLLRSSDRGQVPQEAVADGPLGAPADFGMPTIPEGVPTDFGGGLGGDLGGSGAKQAAYQEMLAAEAELKFAQAAYDAAQGVYEQQRNFNASQAGRLGAQGISVPPPMQPDPSLYQAVLAAQQRYDAAKAAYDAIP